MRDNKRIFKRILNFIIAIALLITMLPVSTITAYADRTNIAGHSVTVQSGAKSGGYSYGKTAYLAYIVDSTGTRMSGTDVVLVSIGSNGNNNGITASEYSSWNTDKLKSRLGNESPSYLETESDWDIPNPFLNGGEGESNSAAVKAWLKESRTHGTENCTNAAWLVYSFWDINYDSITKAKADTNSITYRFFESEEELYLILECAYWMDAGDTTCLATSRGWAEIKSEWKLKGSSDAINWVYPNCITFEATQFGLTPAPGDRLELSDIINKYASGIGSYWNGGTKTSSSQTTADESLVPKPHKAPDESEGTYKIVKNYVTRTKDTTTGEVTYTDDGCYTKTAVTNEISIEDEKTEASTSYSLRNWKVTDSSVESVTSVTDNSLVWSQNVPGNEKSSGTDPTTVDVKKLGGETVYLLLIRDKTETSEVPDEISFEISQSSLTKRVRFSESNRTQVLGNNTFQWYST
jgi:hypothetical protein